MQEYRYAIKEREIERYRTEIEMYRNTEIK